MLYFKRYPFTLLKQSRSFTFLFMYLGELLQYYQSSNSLPQSAQTLDFNLQSCFLLLNTSSCSTHCWLASVSLFALVCLGPRVTLLVVDLSPSHSLFWFVQDLESFLLVVDLFPYQSLPLQFAQHLELICSLLNCLDSYGSLFQLFVLCVETSTRSACCSVVSGGYLNTLTFVGLMFHSPKLLSIRPFSHRFEFGLILSSCFLYFCYWLRQTFTQSPTFARCHKKDRVPYI